MRRIVSVFTAVFVLWSALTPAAAPPAALAAGPSQVPIERTAVGVVDLVSDDTGVQFTLRTPDFAADGEGVLHAPALDALITQAGAPAVPYFSTLIAVPPDGAVEIDVSAGATSLHPIAAVRPAPDALRPESETGLLAGAELTEIYEPDTAVYGRDALFPDVRYTVSEPMYYRDLRVVQLDLFPLRYNPVAGQIDLAEELMVTAVFSGGRFDNLNPAGGTAVSFEQTLAARVLNYEAAGGWRSLPAAPEAVASMLPVGQDSYKVEVNEDGIYELTYADLQAAGMDVTAVDPTTFEMMHRGQPIAYQFAGNPADGFDAGEAVRFYGWAFDGSRFEQQYVDNNVFWLWAGGTPTTVSSVANDTSAAVSPDFWETVVDEPNRTWWPTWTNRWPTFEVSQPDSWYWDFLTVTGSPLVYQFTTPLNDPSTNVVSATFTVEALSRPDLASTHVLTVSWANDNSYSTTRTWSGVNNIYLTTTLPMAELVDGNNTIDIELYSGGLLDRVYINGVTWRFWRETRAVNDWLILGDDGGPRTFAVSDFSTGSLPDAIVWNVTDRLQPAAVALGGGDISGGAGNFTYTFGSADPSGQQFVATTATAVKLPLSISQYNAPDLDPPGGADWVAISYGSFIPEVDVLAAHRSDPAFGGLATHVVDVADVINQFGHGLPAPTAVNDYLSHALANWPTAPSYVLLVGDATHNPRQHVCLFGCGVNPMNTDTQYMMTYLIFTDRFQGQIPSDTLFTFLAGDDHLPELAIGRIPAKTSAEVGYAVDKIIAYEQNQLAPAPWMSNMLFVSDDSDTGGNFCNENAQTAALLHSSFNDTQLCLVTPAATQTLSDAMFDHINITGTLMLNYRGHGSVTGWASPEITNNGEGSRWTNNGRPIMLLSADCLDGYFAWPNEPGLGETFFKLSDVGSAAHWSSSGLGYSSEHSVLHEGFYEALFEAGITRAGDAATYSKIRYVTLRNTTPFNGDLSEVEAFTLLGDPAMPLMRPELSLSKTAVQPTPDPGDNVDFVIDVTNNGLYPSLATITDTLPAGLSYVGLAASVPATITPQGQDVIVELNDPLDWGQTAVLTLTAQVASNYGAATLTNQAVVDGTGLDADLSNQTAADTIQVTGTPPQSVPATPTASGNDLGLGWPHDPDNDAYEIHRSTVAYFTPGAGTLLTTVTPPTNSYTDPGAVGDPATNYFYIIRSTRNDTVVTADSNSVGEFDFALTPGTAAAAPEGQEGAPFGIGLSSGRGRVALDGVQPTAVQTGTNWLTAVLVVVAGLWVIAHRRAETVYLRP